MAECGERVGRGVVTYPCSLDKGHEGPHSALENSASVRQRANWEREQAGEKVPYEAERTPVPGAKTAAQCSSVFDGEQCSKIQGHGGDHVSVGVQGDEGPLTHWDDVTAEEALKVLATMEDDEDGAEEIWLFCAVHDQVFQASDAQRHRDDRHGGDEIIFNQVAGPTRHKREGDQPLPLPNDETYIQDLVIADIERRRELGISRYGTALQPFNGRDAMQDFYDELIDALVYLKQMMVERDTGTVDLSWIRDKLRQALEEPGHTKEIIETLLLEMRHV